MKSPEEAIRQWVEYTAGSATTNTGLKPGTIDVEKYGHHCSYADGTYRYWRFKDKKGYFRFIADYWNELITQ
jgi:hypothetical protein